MSHRSASQTALSSPVLLDATWLGFGFGLGLGFGFGFGLGLGSG